MRHLHRSKFFAVLCMVACSCLMMTVAAFAQPAPTGKDVQTAIKKGGSVDKILALRPIHSSGEWAFVGYTGKSYGYTSLSAVLLKYKNGTWVSVGFSSPDATTDFLKRHKVPEVHWEKLLGLASIAKNQSLLNFLHSKKPGNSFDTIRHAGQWALATYMHLEYETEGQALLKNVGGTWKIVTMGGGALGEDGVKSFGVPAKEAKELYK